MANAQLELACKVGSREAIIEAIEDGADIDFGGGSPLITAILAGDRATVATLIELGADTACFELAIPATEPEAIVDALMQSAPRQDEVSNEDPVDAKLVRSFDRMIRNKGLGEPFKKNRGGEYPAFCDGLKWIAAEECHAVVQAFLEKIEPIRAEAGDAGIRAFLTEQGEALESWQQNYSAVPELPTELLKEYLKERKKLHGSS